MWRPREAAYLRCLIHRSQFTHTHTHVQAIVGECRMNASTHTSRHGLHCNAVLCKAIFIPALSQRFVSFHSSLLTFRFSRALCSVRHFTLAFLCDNVVHLVLCLCLNIFFCCYCSSRVCAFLFTFSWPSPPHLLWL